MKLEGRTAIVTGAGSNLGKVFASRLAADGANVVIADILNHDGAAAEIAESGAKTLGVRADVSSETDVMALVEQTLKAFGRIDILVNNAALQRPLCPFEKIDLDEWRRMMEVNVLGPHLCCRAVVPHMRREKYGRIINIVSASAIKGAPFLLHYVTSKGAMMAFTRSLAREVGPDGITVNALAAGFTITERTLRNPDKLEKFREVNRQSRAIPRDEAAADLVGTLSFLASDDSSFMTGQTLVVDGGSVMT